MITPGPFIKKEDCIYVRLNNFTQSPLSFRLGVRLIHPDGSRTEITPRVFPNFTDGTTDYQLIKNVGPGWIESAYFAVETGTPNFGQTRVEVGIQNGEVADTTKIVNQLLVGFVTPTNPLRFPDNGLSANNRIQYGRFTTQISPGFPAPNPPVTIGAGVIDAPYTYVFHYFQIAYKSDATVATRYLRLDFLHYVDFPLNVGNYFSVVSKIGQTASLTVTYNIGSTADTPGAAVIDNTVSIFTRPMIIEGGNRIVITADNAAAGDEVAISYFVEQLIT